jgi:hypothetical protein
MLFAGDVCTNIMGLGDSVGFESLEEGRASQRKLAGLSFDAAGFGHGKPIAHHASAQFHYKWDMGSPLWVGALHDWVNWHLRSDR